MLAAWWRDYGELARQTLPTPVELLVSVGVGLAVFGLWIQLDAPWMTLSVDSAPVFIPKTADGGLDWPLIGARIAGAALLVPVMEELFWRSFLMRWAQNPVFEGVLPAQVGLRAVAIATFLFVLAHTLWLAAAMAGLAYALLYVRTGKLWTAVIAHAVTNGVLGVWVVKTGNWQFW
jgi:CAAX prenyl protease-like protein